MRTPEWNKELWADLFGKQNLRVIEPKVQSVTAQSPQAQQREKHSFFPSKEKEVVLRSCRRDDFLKVVSSSYGAGNMDRLLGVQVWFTVDDVVHAAENKGYALTRDDASKYLHNFVERGQMESRENITENRIEYRRLKF